MERPNYDYHKLYDSPNMQSMNPDGTHALTYGAALRQQKPREEMERGGSKIPFAAPGPYDDNPWNGPGSRSVAVAVDRIASSTPDNMRAFYQLKKATEAKAEAAAGLAAQQEPLTHLCGQIDVLMHSLKTAYDPATIEELDALLSEHPKPDIVWKAMHAWPRNLNAAEPQGTNTWLTHAVTEAHIEAIAVLMYYGADPLQRCPRRGDQSVHYHNRSRDPTAFHLIATLLNSSSIIKTEKKGYMITAGSEEPFGIEPNARILDQRLSSRDNGTRG